MLPIIKFLPWQVVSAVALGLLIGSMAGCAYRDEGVDFDKELTMKEDGLVYTIREDKPFTGKAYLTVCGRECMPFLHWEGEFKDGKKHGTFVFPESRKSNDIFRPGGKHVVRVKFKDGIEVEQAKVP
ncbi:MAG: hypothetical protein HY914_20595 [Desulfomonile tiedjei]|nr:hypothetical protein [Desulfomonile tiedjei]